MSFKIWKSEKIYDLDDIVFYNTNKKTYQSTLADNQNNLPDSSPDWWKVYVRILYLKNDETGQISEFANPQAGWSPASPEEITAEKLKLLKKAKITELKEKLAEFIEAGFEYPDQSGIFFGLDNDTMVNLNVKRGCPDTMPGRYVFCDKQNIAIDFGDAAEFTKFDQAVFVEKDRIMLEKYNGYKVTINLCQTTECVDNITIDFSK